MTEFVILGQTPSVKRHLVKQRFVHDLPCSALLKNTEQHEEIIRAACTSCYLFMSDLSFLLSVRFTFKTTKSTVSQTYCERANIANIANILTVNTNIIQCYPMYHMTIRNGFHSVRWLQSWLPGRMKIFSTESMAATDSMTSSHPRAAALRSARVRLGGRGNTTISRPSLVTSPLL